jgi:HK97 family phage prohead protease
MRYAVKSAPPPGGAPLEFVMSDGSIDRMGDVIEPAGWLLDNFQSHPIALFNHDRDQVIGKWLDVRVVGKQLLGRLELAAAGTSALVDSIRKLVEQNILRAVSVGFRPLEQKPLDENADKYFGPFRFLKSELLECSLVAVPANPNALATAKSLGLSSDFLSEVFRKSADPTPRAIHAEPGKHLPPSLRSGEAGMPTGNPMKPLSERIVDAQQNLVTYRDQMTAIINANDEPDENAQSQIDELAAKIEAQQKALDSMTRAEAAVAARSALPAPATLRQPIQVMPKTCEPHRHIIRAMAVHFLAKMSGRPLDDVLRERYPGDEGTGVVLRAAVTPAQTTVATWASELVGVAIADFLNQLPYSTIYPRIAAKGPRFTFGRNGIIKVPGRTATPTINGSFVGEGQPIPVRKLGLSSISLTPKKMAVISEFTREMGLHSTPAIEGVIMQAINEDTSVAIDTVLIDATAADTIRPAGLRNGISGLTPSAATAAFDKMVADIKALIAPIVAARGGRDLVLLINTAQSLSLSWVTTPNGQFVFSGVADGNLRNITVVTTTTVPAGMLIMLDASEFASVTGDTPEFDVSDVATIHEEDTSPQPIGTTGAPAVVAAPVRSLWQTASIGVRMMLDMNWTMRRTGLVSWMTGVTW